MDASTPPKLTKEERLAALKIATAARMRRAEIKDKVAQGDMSIAEVIDMKNDDIVGRLKVVELIESFPGYGKAKAEKVMREVGIARTRRLKGLGARQVKELIDRFSF